MDILSILKLQPTRCSWNEKSHKSFTFPGSEYTVKYKLTQMFLKDKIALVIVFQSLHYDVLA